jgi:hypothetical protein
VNNDEGLLAKLAGIKNRVATSKIAIKTNAMMVRNKIWWVNGYLRFGLLVIGY